MLGYLAKRLNPLSLACIQFFACGVLALTVAVFTEPISLETIRLAGWSIAYGGIMSVGVAFSIQVISQRKCPPAHAAIIMSTEAVFAAVAGCALLGETLNARQLTGCALMLAGMLAVQLIALPKQPNDL
jgi:drug/metabolite transporter (DMT)-like permease